MSAQELTPKEKQELQEREQTRPGRTFVPDVDIREDELPEGNYAAVEKVKLSTHNGTHLDAPYHFFPRMNERTVPGGRSSAAPISS